VDASDRVSVSSTETGSESLRAIVQPEVVADEIEPVHPQGVTDAEKPRSPEAGERGVEHEPVKVTATLAPSAPSVAEDMARLAAPQPAAGSRKKRIVSLFIEGLPR
jgi:hypothetical protein